jgi:4-alpha-glucanotransferase
MTRKLDDPARRAGVCLHISSLPGAFGIGEIGGAARDFIGTLQQMGLSVWQFLPLGPTGYGDSPYQPLSSFAGNELLIDVADLIKRRLLPARECNELRCLPHDTVAFEQLIPEKWRVLRIAAARFDERKSASRQAAFRHFCEQHDETWLHDYALYRVLKSHQDNRPWTEWAAPLARREPAALREFADVAAADIRAIKILQFLFFAQWQRLRDVAANAGITLFGDLPIYIALDSAEAWAHPELLLLDEHSRPQQVAGVPPDYFSEDGQLWGNPLYDWERHAADGFDWWRSRLSAALTFADLVRIDHFRGFESYWAVPASDDTAKHGQWLPGPGDALFTALRNGADSLPVVAEDLGVITPEVEALRDRLGLPGMVVLQFALMDPEFRLEDITENRVCYTGTHDNDTTLGWYTGGGDDARNEQEIKDVQNAVQRVLGADASNVVHKMLDAAHGSNARLAIAPMQDLLGLGSAARFNTPGAATSNWRWRMDASAVDAALCRQIRRRVKAAGRH